MKGTDSINYTIKKAGIVLLAAGQSSRMGQPKQLLPYRDTTLLSHAATVAISTGLHPVIIVVGANAGLIKSELSGKDLVIVENALWTEGMGSSLHMGLQTLQQLSPESDGVLFMVCDQPFVSLQLIKQLVDKQNETGLPIAACSYKNKLGTPALFHQSMFKELLKIKGDTGARKLLELYREKVTIVPFEKGEIDIDTKEDYQLFLELKKETS